MLSRSRHRRHLDLLEPPPQAAAAFGLVKSVTVATPRVTVPAEFAPRDYVIFLLHMAAQIEHALMVQYLYAGFSLGGEHVPLDRQREVARWQETILGIAKEEMGHLLTVQNLLRCLGGPLNLDREDYPWDSEFYPFRFHLEPLTRHSLAKYVYAESPDPDLWKGPEADEIREVAMGGSRGSALHRIGLLYGQIERLLENEKLLQDRDFSATTYPLQANWDEWGRGYQAGARGNTTGGSGPGTPDVILRPVTSRSDALDAVRAIVTQGEANPPMDDSAPSHFARFLRIYRQFPKVKDWSPTRRVPKDPFVTDNDRISQRSVESLEGTLISHPVARLWAHLFNIRYRWLLTNLLHSFDYPSNISQASTTTPRGMLVNATFGEMYNLRTLANILVQTPLGGDEGQMAGPPFQMPYTLRLPFDRRDRWRLHRDLANASICLVSRLLEGNSGGHDTYLMALRDTDQQTIRRIETILRDTVASADACTDT